MIGVRGALSERKSNSPIGIFNYSNSKSIKWHRKSNSKTIQQHRESKIQLFKFKINTVKQIQKIFQTAP
jgi:hypothetical protein